MVFSLGFSFLVLRTSGDFSSLGPFFFGAFWGLFFIFLRLLEGKSKFFLTSETSKSIARYPKKHGFLGCRTAKTFR